MSSRLPFAFVLPLLAILSLLACGDDGTGPDDDHDGDTSLELPDEVAGVTLEVTSFEGSELVDTTAAWQASLAALGVSASELSVAFAVAPDSSDVSLEIVSLTADGVDWASRLDAFAAALQDEGQVEAERRTVGGRGVWRARVPGQPASAYYYAVGDILFTIRAEDEGVAAEVLEGISPAESELAGSGAGSQSMSMRSAVGIVGIVLLEPPRPPICVAEPAGHQTMAMMTVVHTEVGPIPDPFVTLISSSSHGEFVPVASVGAHHRLFYAVTRFGFNTPANFDFQAISYMGATGIAFHRFPVQHCMNGAWDDRGRTLRIAHQFGEVTATIETGTLICGAAGQAFSGSLQQNQPIASMAGTDMKACNPPECVAAGLLEETPLVPYTMTLADDGMSADFEWEATLYEYEYDDQGELIACTANGTETVGFSIYRITFGPERPF